jgi:KDO2-lipid IV(A) lauroyltransferase
MSLLGRLNRRFQLRYRLEYVLALFVVYFVRALPPAFAWGGARAIGALLWRLGVRRRVVLENLALAFPAMSEAERRSLGRRTFQHFACVAVDVLFQRRMVSRRNLYRRFEVVGWAKEFLGRHGEEELRRRARRVLFMTAHIGNWELAAGFFSLVGIRIAPVYRAPQNPFLERLLRRLRLERHYALIERRGAVAEMLERFERGENVGFLFDQEAVYGIYVPFLGHPACTHKTPAVLARDFGVKIFFGTMIRRGDFFRYEARGRLLDAFPASEDRAADLERITAHLNGLLEEEIRADPEQYLWMHRRWKRTGAYAAKETA